MAHTGPLPEPWPGDRVEPMSKMRALISEHMVVSRHTSAHVSSIFEVKTVMPRSERDDSRPILLRRCAEHPGLLSVLGAKIDSAYDVEDALKAELCTHAQ